MDIIIVFFIIAVILGNIFDKGLKSAGQKGRGKGSIWGEIERSFGDIKEEINVPKVNQEKIPVRTIAVQDKSNKTEDEYDSLENGSIEDEGLEDSGLEISKEGEPYSLEDTSSLYDFLEGSNIASFKKIPDYKSTMVSENNIFNFMVTNDDLIKAVIYKEIFDKPLCKRDAR